MPRCAHTERLRTVEELKKVSITDPTGSLPLEDKTIIYNLRNVLTADFHAQMCSQRDYEQLNKLKK